MHVTLNSHIQFHIFNEKNLDVNNRCILHIFKLKCNVHVGVGVGVLNLVFSIECIK